MTNQLPPKQVLDHIPAEIVCLDDYEKCSVDFLPHGVHEYIASGVADEVTLRRNREAYESIKILPRALRRCENGSTSTHLFGEGFTHPFLLAPVAHQALVNPQAELAARPLKTSSPIQFCVKMVPVFLPDFSAITDRPKLC